LVQPIQVLIEAVIVEVTLKKDTEHSGVSFAAIDEADQAGGVLQGGVAADAAARSTTSSVVKESNAMADGHKLVAVPECLQLTWTSRTREFIKSLDMFGKTRVLATPRILVLDRQLAELHVGGQPAGKHTASPNSSAAQTGDSERNVHTQLRMRPFVAADKMIRLAIHLEQESVSVEPGNPQKNIAPITTNTTQITTNVLTPVGKTIVICGGTATEGIQCEKGQSSPSTATCPNGSPSSTGDDATRKEIVVFLTPHIWEKGDKSN